MAAEHREPDPLPPRCDATLGREHFSCPFDQVPERHTARTGGLTTPALDARRHELDEVVVDRRALVLHGAHRVDPAPR